MFVKNALNAGQYVELAPVGLFITLQYNERGVLEKVFGINEKEDLTSSLLEPVYKSVPTNIPIKNGTTWVEGVLYTSCQVVDQGMMPYCSIESYTKMYLDNPSQFNFFAGSVRSMAVAFRGASTIRQWLEMAGFRTLPGFLVPSELTEEKFINIASSKFNFQFPLIARYIVFDGVAKYNVDTQIHSHIVLRVTCYTDINGYLKATILCAEGYKLVVDYSDVVKYNLHANSQIVLGMNGNIIYSATTDNKKRPKRLDTVKCDVCGKKISVVFNEPTICEDEGCMSRLYPDLTHMVVKLGLPVLRESTYLDLVSSKSITCLSDVFILPEYVDCKIDTTLGALLNAIVPVRHVQDRSIFTAFANKCTNNIQTFRYYISHPEKIGCDLSMSGKAVESFKAWISVPANLLSVETILSSDNISIKLTDKKFDGEPILRGQTIMVTGKFRHGDLSTIVSILESYSATVVLDFNENVTSIVVGDLHEDVSGTAIRQGKKRHVPVIEESEFFQWYEIDNDLEENL